MNNLFTKVLILIGVSVGLVYAQSSEPLSREQATQSVQAVLQNYVINGFAVIPGTNQHIPTNGHWSATRTVNDACPGVSHECVQVQYSVPENEILCHWIGFADSSLSVVDQDECVSKFFVRKISPEEASQHVEKMNRPSYPPMAEAAHQQGVVTLLTIIDEQGKLSGNIVTSGPSMLRRAAADGIGESKFKPYRLGQKAIPYQIAVSVEFSTSGPGKSSVKTKINGVEKTSH